MLKYLFFIIILCFQISCAVSTRDIASQSDDQIFLSTPEICSRDFQILSGENKCYKFSSTVSVLGKKEGHNIFDFPLIQLDSPYYEEVSYLISIKSDDEVSCIHSQSIKKISKNTYAIKNNLFADFFRCSYEGDSQGSIEFTYEIPYFQSFEVSKAEWMKGFFPNIVNNTELLLAQILSKWNETSKQLKDKDISNAISYRGRELLLKYEGNNEDFVFDPNKNKFQYEKLIAPGDIIRVKNLSGSIIHPYLGKSDYKGVPLEEVNSSIELGDKFLMPKGVLPNGFFCTINNQLYTFVKDSSYTFDKPGLLKCSLNTRRNKILWFKKAKGQVEASFESLNLELVMQRLHLTLANAKVRISNKIKLMNQANISEFKKWIERALHSHRVNLEYLKTVEEEYPFSIKLKSKLGKVELFHRLSYRLDVSDSGQEIRFVNLNVFSKNYYTDEKGTSFSISEKYLGQIKTSLLYGDPEAIDLANNKYLITEFENKTEFNQFNKKYFEENYKNLISLTGYINELNSLTKKNIKKSRPNPEVIILKRFNLKVCGDVRSYNAPNGEVKELVILTNTRAIYDTITADIKESQRELYLDSYYKIEKSLNMMEFVYTGTPFVKSRRACYLVTPGNFANQNYQDSILINSL